jgi:hypothetical protein
VKGVCLLIKGVNRRIIEILNPEDVYFERVILFLNPDIPAEEPSLGTHTGEYLKELTQIAKQKRKRKLPRRCLSVLKFAGCAAAGGGITALFLL